MDKKLSSLRSWQCGEREIKSLSPFSSRLRRLVVKTLFRVRLQYRQLRRLKKHNESGHAIAMTTVMLLALF